MEQKQSKVTEANFWQESDSQYGKLYAHIVKMENGDEGVYNSKSQNQDKFVVGNTVSYEWRPPKEGKKLGLIKPVRQQSDQQSTQQSQPQQANNSQPATKNVAKTGSVSRFEVVREAAHIAKDIVIGRGELSGKDFDGYFKAILNKFDESL